MLRNHIKSEVGYMNYPSERNLDSVYFRVFRDNRYTNKCFSDLTREEMKERMERFDKEGLINMCIILGETLRKIGDDNDLFGNLI